MDIAIIKRRFSLRQGGSERHCVTISRQLQQLGHRVSIVGETIDPELTDEVRFLPVKVNHATSWSRNRSFAENSAQVVHQHHFDLVYGLSRSQAADVFRLTDRLQAHWMNVYYPNPLNRFLQHFNPRHRTILDIERSIYGSQRVRRIITQSMLDRRLVNQYYGVPEEKIRTIYNGVDISLFNPSAQAERQAVRAELGLTADQPLLIFASMDFEGKNLRAVLAALSRMTPRNAHLLVLGTGPERKFARVAVYYGVRNRVTFAGRQSYIQRFYGAGDLFVLPTAYEPFPNVNLEALATGLPVLTSATHGGADIIQDGRNGYVVSHGQAVEEMVERLNQHFALSASQRHTMSQNCWETAQGMTLENYTPQLMRVFEEVLVEKFRV